jgi:hypothetical protein
VKQQFLDLDALVEADITLKLNGVTHQYKEMSVEDFIWLRKKAKEFEALPDTAENEDVFMTSSIEMVLRHFPTMKEAELQALGLTKLKRLSDFVMSISMQGADDTVADALATKSEEAPAAGNEQAGSPQA